MSRKEPTTVGRIVWFWASKSILEAVVEGKPRFTVYNDDQPCAAQVIAVWNDDCVNLKVTDHAGQDHIFTSVSLRGPSLEHSDDEAPTRHGVNDHHGETVHYATWMPYQVKAKPEATAPVQLRQLEDNGKPVADDPPESVPRPEGLADATGEEMRAFYGEQAA